MLNKADFLNQDKKAITIMGMSGVGKTTLALKMQRWGWEYFSCDYEIGKHALSEEMLSTLGEPVNTVTPNNLSQLSRYVGQVGKEALGGIEMLEFKRRQRAYLDAERQAVNKACDLMDQRSGNFIHDSTGSLCELNDNALMSKLSERSLLIYILADEQDTSDLMQRAQDDPKPLFFPAALFDGWVRSYMQEKTISDYGDIEPNDFSRWVFPRLYESRLPKYKRLADRYGITIYSKTMAEIEEEEDLFAVIEDHL